MPRFPARALFACLLLMLLVFQQATACYDGHSALAETDSVSVQELDECSDADMPCEGSTQSGLDQECNHCCHCHAGASLCLPAGHYAQWSLYRNHWVAATDAAYPHEIISALYRPPIA